MTKKNYSYGLYQTLISSQEEVPLSEIENQLLLERMENLSYNRKEAVFMIIFEYARVNDNFIYDSNDLKLPYSMKGETNKVIIDMSKLPLNLKRMLWRFSNVIDYNQ